MAAFVISSVIDLVNIVENNKIYDDKESLTVVTHNGDYHADECMAIALLRRKLGDVLPIRRIVRARPKNENELRALLDEKDENVLVIDVMLGWLDHHGPRQKECVYWDETPKASIALVEDLLNDTAKEGEWPRCMPESISVSASSRSQQPFVNAPLTHFK